MSLESKVNPASFSLFFIQNMVCSVIFHPIHDVQCTRGDVCKSLTLNFFENPLHTKKFICNYYWIIVKVLLPFRQ